MNSWRSGGGGCSASTAAVVLARCRCESASTGSSGRMSGVWPHPPAAAATTAAARATTVDLRAQRLFTIDPSALAHEFHVVDDGGSARAGEVHGRPVDAVVLGED